MARAILQPFAVEVESPLPPPRRRRYLTAALVVGACIAAVVVLTTGPTRAKSMASGTAAQPSLFVPGMPVRPTTKGTLHTARASKASIKMAAGQREIEVTPMTQSEADKVTSGWGTWGSPVTKFDWQWSGEEHAWIIQGEATITPTGEWKDSKPVTIKAGDFCKFPDGMTCIWDVTKPISKYYTYP